MHRAIILCMLLCLIGAAFAAEETQQENISLQLNDVDISEALAELSQQAKVSILGDSTVKGRVTCSLNNVTVEQALDIICRPNKLMWLKSYIGASGESSPNAGSLFKLFDALKEIEGSTLICEDPKAKSQTVFVRDAEAGAVDASAVASGLKLREVYLVRAEPDPAAIAAEKEKQEQQALAMQSPPQDPKVAADQVWNYFGRMPVEQQFEVMRELRQLVYQSLTPEQMRGLREMFGGRTGRPPWGDGSPREGRPPRQ